MKKIEAIIKPFKLEDVKQSLEEAGIDGITVSEVKGFSRKNAHREIFRGTQHTVDSLPEIKIELTLEDDHLDAAVAAIVKGTKAARQAEGKIFVSEVHDALRLEHAHAA